MKKILCTLFVLSMVISVLASCGKTESPELLNFKSEDYSDVIAMIDAIDEASFENEAAIDEAYNTYNALTGKEKALVTNYDKLEAFLDELAAMYNTSPRRGERMNRNQILLGTYCFYFTDEAHIKEYADAGFDYITAVGYNYNKEQFDLFAKYDIGVFLSGLPQWRGDDRLPEDPQPEPTFGMDYYADALKTVVDHEAIWGIDIIDEPSALDFPFIGQQVDTIYDVLPGYFAYVNLHPGHGRARLGTVNQIMLADGYSADYREYISNYIKDIDTDYVCYDHYFYQNGAAAESELIGALFMQKTVSAACDENDKDFWIVIQANSRNDQTQPAVPLSLQQLQTQAFIALSYGVRSINWACWQPGWWSYNIYDGNGNRTEQYEKVASVNEDIKRISPVYIRYKHLDTCTLGRVDRDRGDMVRYFDNEFDSNIKFKNLEVDGLSFVIAGYFEKNVGSKGAAMMFTNVSDKMCDNLYPNIAKISFEVEDPDAVVTAYIMGYPKVLEPVNGVYSFNLDNAEYAFVTIE